MLLSFVIPCYRSEKTIGDVVSTITETMKKRPEFDLEMILVNDGSPDGTWETILDLTKKYGNVTGIDLAKNSGQQNAIMAGLRHTRGDLVAVCDDDGQTPVETILAFLDKMEEGDYDMVCANYEDRGKRSLFRSLGSWANTKMLIFFLDKPREITTSVYFLAKRFVIDEMVKYENAYPYMNGLMLRSTNRIGNVSVVQHDRAYGSSGYNMRKLLSTWVNGLTTFSIKPLRMAVFLGLFMSIAGFIATIAIIIVKLTHSNIVLGWSSLMTVNILIGGMLMLILGVIGEYIGRIYLCLNHQPQYVIRSVVSHGKKQEGNGKEETSDNRS